MARGHGQRPSGGEHRVEVQQLVTNRDVERARGGARRGATQAAQRIVVGRQPPRSVPGVMSSPVILEVHGVAEDIVHRHVVRAVIQARAAAGAAVVLRDGARRSARGAQRPLCECLSGGVQVLVDLVKSWIEITKR